MFFAGTPSFMLPRSLMHRSSETGIPAAPSSSTSNDKFLIRLGELECLLAGLIVIDDGSYRNFQHDIDALAPGLVRALAVTASLGLVLGVKAEMHERVVPLAGFHDDVAAFTAVTARRTAAGDELLPAKGHAAVAAVSGFHANFGFIDKHGNGRGSLVKGRCCRQVISGMTRQMTNGCRPTTKKKRPRSKRGTLDPALVRFHGRKCPPLQNPTSPRWAQPSQIFP